jgi:hypothetical protein
MELERGEVRIVVINTPRDISVQFYSDGPPAELNAIQASFRAAASDADFEMTDVPQ